MKMTSRLTAIMLSAAILTSLTACGAVDDTADVKVTTEKTTAAATSAAGTWRPELITSAQTTASAATSASTTSGTTKKTTAAKDKDKSDKTTTTKKTTASQEQNGGNNYDNNENDYSGGDNNGNNNYDPGQDNNGDNNGNNGNNGNSVNSGNLYTTQANKTTTAKKTTTSKKTTTKKQTTTTAAQAKLTQSDVDRLVREMQEYSRQKSKPFIDSIYADCGYSSAEELMSIMEREMTPNNSSWDNPERYYAKVWTYSDITVRLKNTVDAQYSAYPDVHIVVYAEKCSDEDGVYWKMYMLR